MFLRKGLKQFPLPGRVRQKAKAGDMHSFEAFWAILERERARADRNGHGFSLVTFDVAGGTVAEVFTEQLKGIIFARLRATDEVGWFDKDSIGVLLYNTPMEGAWNYADYVRRELPSCSSLPQCHVYTYPVHWEGFDDEKGSPRGKNNKQDVSSDHPVKLHSPRTAAASFQKSSTNARLSRSVVGTNVLAFEPDMVRAQHQKKTSFDLYPFFVGPMPVWKRFMDILGAVAAIIVMSPVMLVIAMAIRLTTKGPVLFRQQRAGLKGKPFICYKFRTMVVDAEAQKKNLFKFNERSGVAFKMKNDPRVTPIGRFLRKTSLDELPQLFNVLKGEMSLVGPRPLPVEEALEQDKWHNLRLEVTPGITCLWQVYARHTNSFDLWARLDIAYVRERSFLLDIKLLFMTIPAVLSAKGAH